jgi:hypothetical protein
VLTSLLAKIKNSRNKLPPILTKALEERELELLANGRAKDELITELRRELDPLQVHRNVYSRIFGLYLAQRHIFKIQNYLTFLDTKNST